MEQSTEATQEEGGGADRLSFDQLLDADSEVFLRLLLDYNINQSVTALEA